MAKVNISLPDELLEQVDSLAEELNLSRSGLIQEASARYVTETLEERARIEREESITEAMKIARELSEKNPSFDAEAAIRFERDHGHREI